MLFNNFDKSLQIYQSMVNMSHEPFVLTNTENLFTEHFPQPSPENEDANAIVDFITLIADFSKMVTISAPFIDLLDHLNSERDKVVSINNEYHNLVPIYGYGTKLIDQIVSLMKETSDEFAIKIKQYNISSESAILRRYVEDSKRTEAPLTCVTLLKDLLNKTAQLLLQLNSKSVSLIDNPDNDEELTKYNNFVLTVRTALTLAVTLHMKNYKELVNFLI